MHNLFLVYFVSLYMFRAYLGPSSGGKPYVHNIWYLLLFLDWNQSNQNNRQSSKKNNTDKSLARPGRKQATAIGDFDFYISYL